MQTTRDWQDLIAGGLVFLTGLAVLVYCLVWFRMGTLSRMGPGMFPAGVGLLMMGLGVGIFLPALRRAGRPVRPDLRATGFILMGILGFSFVLVPFGLIPAIVLATVLTSLADGRLRPAQLAALAGFLSALITLIFVVGLRIQVRLFAWPW